MAGLEDILLNKQLEIKKYSRKKLQKINKFTDSFAVNFLQSYFLYRAIYKYLPT